MSSDLYQLKLESDYAGQSLLNIYHYRGENFGGESASDLAEAFEQAVLPSLLPICQTQINFVSIEVVSYETPTDFATRQISASGTAVGPIAPIFVGTVFRLNRSSRAIRNGRKTIPGPLEEWIGGLGVFAGPPSVQSALDAAAGAMEAGITSSNNGGYLPRIVRVDPLAPLGYTLDVAVQSVDFVRFSTQNSRKPF